jgi:hypothetical protein
LRSAFDTFPANSSETRSKLIDFVFISSVASELLSFVGIETMLTLLLAVILLFLRPTDGPLWPVAYCVFGLSVAVFKFEVGEP